MLIITSQQVHIIAQNKMDPFRVYYYIFEIGYLILGIISAVTVLLVGCCVLTPGKVVRILFPYIKRNGNNTVMFGYILTRGHITGLFMEVSWIIVLVTLTFCTNILIIYKNNNNLFSATSIELQCYYANGTIAELTAIERLQLDEDILCYAINFNIAGAMGQATGALAFGWILTSVLTWIVLNMNYCIIQRVKNSKRKLMCYKLFLLINATIIMLLTLIAKCILLGLYYYYDTQWVLYLSKPENVTIFIILMAVMFFILLAPSIRKEPKSLEECCREIMKTKQKEEMNIQRGHEITQLNEKKQSILREIAEHKCKILIAHQTALDINNEEKIMDIVLTAFNNIMQQNNVQENGIEEPRRQETLL